MNKVCSFSDKELVQHTENLREKERELLHELLPHFAEIDERKLYREEGYSSMFSYLHEGLRYSEGAACRRMKVARCISKYPEVYEALVDADLTLASASELSRAVEDGGFLLLLEKARGKTVAEVSRFVARPKATKRKESVRVIRSAPVKTEEVPLFSKYSDSVPENTTTITAAAAVTKKGTLGYQVSMEVDEEFMALYLEAKAIAGGHSMREVMKKVLKGYTTQHSPKERTKRREKRKMKRNEAQEFSALPADGEAEVLSPESPSRHIPVAIRDEVHIRDGGRCSYVSASGVPCSAIGQLEYDHITPWANRPDHSVENIRLRCRAHNLLAAEEVFGKEFMQRKMASCSG